MSSQTGDESSVLSGGITSFLVNLFNIKDLETFHFFIRKMAHVTIYALLGFFILNAFVEESITKPMVMHSFFIALIYAISDEIHQTFIPARSGNVIDVLIDSVGILIGLSLFIKVKPHFTK
jgi:VanZ family protein